MAPSVVSSSIVAPATFASAAPAAAAFADTNVIRAFSGLKGANVLSAKTSQLSGKTVSNGSRVNCMLVWEPYNNPRFETLSYLPALTEEQTSKQVEYIIRKGWIPCLEFDRCGNVHKNHFRGSGYYDGRYWTMWKLPMFGCKDSGAVMNEINECSKAYPDCYVRVLGFDNKRQVQCCSFVVRRPA